jgi:hypothetical protein
MKKLDVRRHSKQALFSKENSMQRRTGSIDKSVSISRQTSNVGKI